jgi:hypothetical protein
MLKTTLFFPRIKKQPKNVWRPPIVSMYHEHLAPNGLTTTETMVEYIMYAAKPCAHVENIKAH